jgi:hypothetical protein
VPDADAAPLMTAQINDYATTLSCDARERPVQLTAAIASHRPEPVAREAFGMNPNKDVRRACHMALHQSGVLIPSPAASVARRTFTSGSWRKDSWVVVRSSRPMLP